MEKYAEVVVNKSTPELDKLFTYLITEKLIDKVKIGSRVLVPFGSKNYKIEAFVINIVENCEFKNVKAISDVVDTYPIFNEKMLHLAHWMKDEYMCTYLECLKCIAPTGISIKSKKNLKLNINYDSSKVKSELQERIINVLKDNNGQIEFDQLIKIIDSKSLSSIIGRLEENNVLTIEYELTSMVKDKLLRVASLGVSYEEAQLINNSLSDKFSAQKRILNILMDNEYIAVSDLVKFADASYSAVNSLMNKNIIVYDEIEVLRDPYACVSYTKSEPLELTNEQKLALNSINQSISKNLAEKFLLHGITGSGKTEVYLQAIDHAIKLGGQAIVLVPEISLTPQTVERFKSRFGENVAVIHSRLSLGERFDEWKKIKNSQVSIAIGARSAIFAPFENLKLIIVDEEHESSYKSENKPKYNIKSVAEKRSQLEGCSVVYGSATPSIETYFSALNNEYKLIKMNNRVNKCILPKVTIVDMRNELEEGNRTIFSRLLYSKLEKNIQNNEQSILFLNRRGYSTFVSCRQCGITLKCPYCNISLTYHSYSNILMCHYCGHTEKNPTICPACSSKYIKYFGIGTQKIEEEVRKAFPNASVLRMDFDTTSTKFSHQRILDTFRNDNINVLIGTQMIAKGLDFPNVTLVGVISADTSLNIDDFRSSERTFQLLTQVAGRSGRGEKQGSVVVQTYQPEEFSIITAKDHDYENFYQNEILMRKNLNYPPYTNIASIIISHSENNIAKGIALEIHDYLKSTLISDSQNIFEVFHPTLAPLSKIKQMHRWRIILKANNLIQVKEYLKNLESKFYDEVNISIDINPLNML